MHDEHNPLARREPSLDDTPLSPELSAPSAAFEDATRQTAPAPQTQTPAPALEADAAVVQTASPPIRTSVLPPAPAAFSAASAFTRTAERNHSVWRTPEISARWWPVFLRNLLVWRKLAIPSLIGNIAEPLMWLVAFGYGMGALVGSINVGGVKAPYILFLASGSICMSAMNAASFEALYSAFSRMHVQKTWDGIMNAPVSLDNIVLAELLWAGFKAAFTVTAILCVMLALGISHSPKLLMAWPILVVAGIMFASIALIFNALAKGYDFFTYYFTLVLTPMMFLSGVFFPREQLPTAVQFVANWLPLANVVDLVRPLFLNQWPADAWLHGLRVVVYTVGAFWTALALTRKRFSK